jgi:hypothetical protein
VAKQKLFVAMPLREKTGDEGSVLLAICIDAVFHFLKIKPSSPRQNHHVPVKKSYQALFLAVASLNRIFNSLFLIGTPFQFLAGEINRARVPFDVLGPQASTVRLCHARQPWQFVKIPALIVLLPVDGDRVFFRRDCPLVVERRLSVFNFTTNR